MEGAAIRSGAPATRIAELSPHGIANFSGNSEDYLQRKPWKRRPRPGAR